MKKKLGFTLIELLVAMTLGLLIVGFGAVSLNQFNEKQKVKTVTEELIAELKMARNYAVTNQLPTGLRSDIDRVAVVINSDGLVTVGAQTSGNENIGGTFFSKDITPKNVLISADKDIIFSVTDGRSINGTTSIIINGVDSTKNIMINESGLIYEK